MPVNQNTRLFTRSSTGAAPWMLRRLVTGLAVVGLTLGLASCATPPAATSAPSLHPAPEAKTLAPTGELRVGVYLGSPTSLVRTAQGEARGLTVELGAELAKTLGVPHRLVEFGRLALVLDAMKTGAVDFTITNATPARARDVNFSPTVVGLELGLLVPANATLASPDDMDRAGLLIGVTQGSTSQGVLSQRLKAATVVPVATLQDAAKKLSSGELSAFATNKAILFEMLGQVPGGRVLPGRWGSESLAIAIPKGREAAMPTVQAFAQRAATSGLVNAAAERAGLRGTMTAP